MWGRSSESSASTVRMCTMLPAALLVLQRGTFSIFVLTACFPELHFAGWGVPPVSFFRMCCLQYRSDTGELVVLFAAPVASYLTPFNGPAVAIGTLLTVSGMNFGSSGSMPSVVAGHDNGVDRPCAASLWVSGTSLLCTAPSGSGYNQRLIVVLSSLVGTTGLLFTFDSPTAAPTPAPIVTLPPTRAPTAYPTTATPSLPPIDCAVSEWNSWSPCSATCDGGERSRTKSIRIPQQGTGQACPSTEAFQGCGFSICPVDCIVGSWQTWGLCDASTATRVRAVVRPQEGTGALCPATRDTLSCTPNQNCEVTAWASWAACTQTCGGGVSSRTRVISQTMFGSGTPCPSTTDTASCNTLYCPVDCAVGSWQEWGACTVSCGTGSSSRSRFIAEAASFGGMACPASLTEALGCATGACPASAAPTTAYPTSTITSSGTVYLILSGNVNDYTPTVLTSIRFDIATKLTVSPNSVQVQVSPGSVVLTVTISGAGVDGQSLATQLISIAQMSDATIGGIRVLGLASSSNSGLGSACSGATSLTSSSGTISDGPDSYGPNVQCSWLIQTGAAVTLTFSAFATEGGYDLVKVYSGSTASAPLLGSFSGTSTPAAVTS